jgi:hypothetical protein
MVLWHGYPTFLPATQAVNGHWLSVGIGVSRIVNAQNAIQSNPHRQALAPQVIRDAVAVATCHFSLYNLPVVFTQSLPPLFTQMLPPIRGRESHLHAG